MKITNSPKIVPKLFLKPNKKVYLIFLIYYHVGLYRLQNAIGFNLPKRN